MMQINFYILGERYALNSANTDTASDPQLSQADSEAVLLFVCKLIQTAVKKSEHSLVVVDDQPERLQLLDTLLWTFDTTSFIPHELIVANTTSTALLSAPVTLLSQMPHGFDGVILNLGSSPLPIFTQQSSSTPALNAKKTAILPERVLEIISPDSVSKEQGRQKYRTYRDLGFTLMHYKID
ncbi:DNA polymerase III subunit chi [Psychrobacter lutiphocae]|uniref:DNA polymerase III subunit chi n=1 Tax=Psychrobacter lutiphocae TaxID=540500 RepID=UPI000366CE8D|nr:DNA polymerase III subunit chi [Psychrobacter lutiphocae]